MNPELTAKKHSAWKEKLKKMLLDHGTMAAVARATGVSRQAAHKMFKRYGMVEYAKKFKADLKAIDNASNL